MASWNKTGLIMAAAFAAAVLAFTVAPAQAEVNVNINIGPPPVLVEGPPELIVVPRTMIYFAPAARGDLFFFSGYWWTRHDGRWFRARAYNGPWKHMGPRYVPVEIVRLPGNYRTAYVHEHRVPYGQLKKHWERREHDRRKRMGEWKDWKEEKHERKAREKEMKREMKEERKEHKEHGRGH
ncbi:MAG: hypothetical protein HY896_04265 [Deltaproteobacteria bacterium]|nr:hypothetical protein [Deltaproteobacteria bacterium]